MFFWVMLFLIFQLDALAQTTTITVPGTDTFRVPDGVTSITVEVWGAGGRGGARSSGGSNDKGSSGGGGGGAYSRSILTVTPGQQFSYTVGLGTTDPSTIPGGDSFFGSATTVMAKGGNSAPNNNTVGATGGDAAQGVGTVKFSGGNGANGGTTFGGGGGSSAGTGSIGTNGNNQNGGIAPQGGGNGGLGRSGDGDGGAGSNPGGGGGGARKENNSPRIGGKGGNGRIIITWTCPAPVLTSGASSNNQSVCIGTPISNITYVMGGAYNATFSGLPDGVTGSYSNGNVTIKGSPTQEGTSSYTITPVGGCESNKIFGSISVTPNNTFGTITSNTFCAGIPLPDDVLQPTTGATGLGAANGLPDGVSVGFIGNDIVFSGTPTQLGSFEYSILLTGGCGNESATGTLVINEVAAVSNSMMNGQTVCVGSPFSPISISPGVAFTYQWFRNSSLSITGGTLIDDATSNTYTPSSTTVGTSYYYVQVLDACGGSVTSSPSGAFVVNPGNTVSGASYSPTVCVNQAISPIIMHTTTGATGIGASNGLPNGVVANWTNGTITISGTPSESGEYNYSIPLTGGCGTANATGTLTVNAIPAITSQNTPTQAVCINSPFDALSIPEETGLKYKWYSNTIADNSTGTAISGADSASFTPPSNVEGTLYYFVEVSGACGSSVLSAVSGAQVVNPLPVITFTAQPSSTSCVDADLTYTTQPGESNYVWTIPGILMTDYSITSGGTSIDSSVTIRWLTAGSKSISVNYTNGNGCTASSPTASNAITVNKNTFSASNPVAPTVCVRTALSPVTIATTLATGIGTPSGLPIGVSASFANNTISISGTPTIPGTYNYSIPLTGGCGTVSATGTIVVTPVYELTSTTSVSPNFSGGTAAITMKGDVATIPNGTYTVTYRVGLANSGGPYTITVNFVNGVGTFNTGAITNPDLTSLEILTLRRPNDICTVSIIENNITFFGICMAVYQTNGNFFVPAEITEITVEVWGGGGRGGSGATGAGGGGGAYSTGTNVAVSPGETLAVTVGAGGNSDSPDGGNSYITKNPGGASLLYANGGLAASGSSLGTGGEKDSRYDGVNGNPGLSASGTSGGNGGKGGSASGGNGGLGKTTIGAGNGRAGRAPGGGGGGTNDSNSHGGNGGNGLVVIKYSCPPVSPDACFQVVDDGAKSGNTIIKFTCAESEWIPPTGLLDFTVVAVGAGGGGGMGNTGGGGGAGGLSSSSVFTTNPNGMDAGTAFNIRVGQGGVGATSTSMRGGIGGNSEVTGVVDGNSINISSPGGGGGGSFFNGNPANGAPGASGGGGAYFRDTNYQGAGGAGTNGLGYAGGVSDAKLFQNDPDKGAATGGGGGGAAGPGTSGQAAGAGQALGGAGGNGLSYNFLGFQFVYGGGGGGVGFNFNGQPFKAGDGGIGPDGSPLGGNGNKGIGFQGTDQTGSGGGAGTTGGGRGGSGVVYIIYENFRILPVEYIFIKAEYLLRERFAEVSWATAMEWENSHFEVERSFQNINNWEFLGKVDGMGYSDEPVYYTFQDKNLPLTGGTVYYRLRQVDFSGNAEYSKVLSVRIPALQFTQGVWRAYPNPTNGDQLRISLLDRNQYDDEAITFRIIHPMMHSVGKSVSNEAEMNEILGQVARSVPRGVFVVEIQWGQNVEHIKVLKR